MNEMFYLTTHILLTVTWYLIYGKGPLKEQERNHATLWVAFT